MFVFWGLWNEKKADKKEYLDVNDFRSQKLKSERGWRILMIGIGIEIVTGAAITGYSVWENVQTATQIEKNDPQKQPIKSITAQVYLLVSGTNWQTAPFSFDAPINSGMPMCLHIWGKDSRLITLPCKEFSTNSTDPNYRIYSMEFGWPSGDFRSTDPNFNSWIEKNNVPMDRLDREMVAVKIPLYELGDGSEIVQGSCVITFNGLTQRQFLIPKIYKKDTCGFAEWPVTRLNRP
jgi:hypothetical protein